MRHVRFLRTALLSGSIALVAAACSGGAAPGWTYQPAPAATPVPSIAASGEPSPGATPTAAASQPSGGEPSGSAPAASGEPSGEVLTVVAQNIEFVEKELTAPADTEFQITLDNQDAGTPHDIDIRDGSGGVLDDNEIFNGVAQQTFDVPALAAGEYTFICSVHPIPAMTGTLTVQ